MLDDPQPQQPAIDPDLLSAGYAPPLRKIVRGADKLNGVQPDLLDHWNNLQGEFDKAGLQPEIKSGYRTTQQQQSLFNNPATRARTKGNDGIVNISPHQEGRALDISFPSTQKAKGHQIIADYAKRNGLHVPSDEPWHIALPKATPTIDPDLLNAGFGQEPAKTEAPNPLAGTLGTYVRPPSTPDGIDSDLLAAGMGQEPLKTPQTSVTLGEGAIDESQPLKPLNVQVADDAVAALKEGRPRRMGDAPKPVAFNQGTVAPENPASINPVENIYNDLSKPDTSVRGIAGLQAKKFETPDSHQLGDRVTLPISSHVTPSEDEVVQGYLSTLGPEYVKAGEQYKSQTGHNILTLGGGALKQDEKGNYYVRPSKGAVDFINTYVQSGGDLNKAGAEANRQADEYIAAQNKALTESKPDVEQAHTAIANIKDSPLERKMFQGTAGAAQAFGSVLPGSLGNEFERQAAVEKAAGEQLDKDQPFTTTRERILGGIGGLIPTAAMLIATHKLGPAQLAALGALEGSTPQERLRGGLQGAAAQAVLGGAPAAFSEAGLPTTGKAVTSAAMVGQPAVEAMQRGESPVQAITENLPFAVLPFLSKGGGAEKPTELGIDHVQTVGVHGEATANIDRTIAAREAAVRPTTQPEDVPAMRVRGAIPPDTRALETGDPKLARTVLGTAAAQRGDTNEANQSGQDRSVLDKTVSPVEATPGSIPGEQSTRDVLAGQPDLAEQGNEIEGEQRPDTLPVRHVDLQARDEEGKFDKETVAQAEERRAKVSQSVTPEPAQPDQASRASAPAVETPIVSKPESEPPPSVTSSKKDQLAADRAELDLPELPQTERKGWRTSLINAKEKGLDQQAERLADQVLTNPRALDDEQTAGIVLRLQQLKNEHAGLLDAINKETNPDALAQHRADLESVENSFDKITEAVKKSGTEKGRSLASQKLTINQDYDLVSMLNRYKAKTGKEPTPEIRAQIEQQQARIADLEKQLAEQSTKGATDRMRRDIRRENRARTRKVLDEEAATIKSNIAAEFARLKSTQSSTHSLFGLGNLDPEGIITKHALQYARNRFEAGITDARQLVDDVHGVLSEFLDGVTKRQVAEMISGYGREGKDNRSELTKRLITLKADMKRDLAAADVAAGVRSERPQGPRLSEKDSPLLGPRQGPRLSDKDSPLLGQKQGPKLSEKDSPLLGPKQGPRLSDKDSPLLGPKYGPRLSEKDSPLIGPRHGPRLSDAPKVGPRETKPEIQRRYQKQINEIERRIREQDFAPKAKRGPTVLDPDTEKIHVNLERAKQNFQRQLRTWQDSQRSPAEKAADLTVKWGRAAKLMYASTLGKLSSAATGRMIMSPIENLVGEIPHRLMPELSRRSTTEGGGFDKAAEAAALWKSGRFRQVLNQITKGSSDLDVLFGSQSKLMDKEMSGQGALGIPGRIHAAMKEYPRQAEFDRARAKVLRNYERAGRDVTRPDVQLAANMEAFNSAERARFQQRNFVSDTFNDAMASLERKGIAGKAASKVGRFIFPITRVPVNVVGETLNYTFGIPRAVIETAIRGGVQNLTPEQANNIMRAYKKGGVGLAMMAYAFFNPQQFGGYYQKGDKRPVGDAQPGEIMFFGHRVPKMLTHVPILEAGQLAATSRRVMDAMASQGKADSTVEGGIAAGKGLAEGIPFYETPARFFTGQEGSRGVAQFAGEQVRGMVPGFLQEYAKSADQKDPVTGKPVVRSPQGSFTDRFKQSVELGLPGFRKNVPINEKIQKAGDKQAFVDRMRNGDVPPDGELRGQGFTSPQIKEMKKDAKLSSAQVAFSNAQPDQALERFERMDERQRFQVQKQMEHKAFALKSRADYLLNNARPEDKEKRQQERDALQQRLDTLKITPRDPKEDRPSANPFKIGSGAFKVPAFK